MVNCPIFFSHDATVTLSIHCAGIQVRREINTVPDDYSIGIKDPPSFSLAGERGPSISCSDACSLARKSASFLHKDALSLYDRIRLPMLPV